MKFIRRTEGVKHARLIFKRGREDPRSTYHVYVAAALMEYYCSKVIDKFDPFCGVCMYMFIMILHVMNISKTNIILSPACTHIKQFSVE